MFLIPQMLTEETLRARYQAGLQKVSALSPRSPAAKALQEEISALKREHERRGLPIEQAPPEDPKPKKKLTRKKSA